MMDRLVEDVDKVLGGQAPTYDDVNERLPYLHAVVKETLRLHPSVPKVSRAFELFQGHRCNITIA